jgi:ParB-like chromosome segregation protein Spo0J
VGTNLSIGLHVGDLPLPGAYLDRPGRRFLGRFNLPISRVRVGEGEPLRPVNPVHVRTLVAALQGGAEFPPIIVRADGTVVDGHHRLRALATLGRSTVRVLVYEYATSNEALAHGVEANVGNGRQFTSTEKRALGRRLLQGNMPTEDVAALVAVDPRTVRGWGRESRTERRKGLREQILRLHKADWSQERIADAVGVTRDQVRTVVAKLDGRSSVSPRHPRTRQEILEQRPAGEKYILGVLDGLEWQIAAATAALLGLSAWPGSRGIVGTKLNLVLEKLGAFVHAARLEGLFAEGDEAQKPAADQPMASAEPEGDTDPEDPEDSGGAGGCGELN